MKHCVLLLTFAVVLVCVHALTAGPEEPTKPIKDKEISADAPLETRVRFKGGERATVIVKGDLKTKADLLLEIHDKNGQLVTKDDGGGQFLAVIWYPPQTDVYTIKVSVKGQASVTCDVIVR